MKKKLLTILLSIAVILTSTITVFANEITNVGDVIATNPNFPSNPEDGWTLVGDGVTAITYVYNDKLYFQEKGNPTSNINVATTATLTKYNDNYTVNSSDGKVTFVMKSNSLRNIMVSGSSNNALNGTYTILLYWGYDYSTKTLYLSKTASAITTKGLPSANVFDATETYTSQSVGWAGIQSDVEKVEILNEIKPSNMNSWFDKMSNLTQIIGLTNLNTESVVSMSGLFNKCEKLETIDLSNFDTSNVTSMQNMFAYCSNLTSLTFGEKFDTSKVTNMSAMFSYCSNLTSLTFGEKFDTSKVTNMSSMFGMCSSLETLTFGSSFITTEVTNIGAMFYNCSSLETLDLSNFDFEKVTFATNMLNGATALSQIKTPKNLTKDVSLPTLTGTAAWYNGNIKYADTKLPKNSATSSTLVAGYPITVSKGITNGTVTVAVAPTTEGNYIVGSTVTLTVAPSDGYQLKANSLKATYNDGVQNQTIIPTATQTEGQYTFTMPAYTVIVTAEFEEKAITIADILPADFPTTKETGWVNEHGARAYKTVFQTKDRFAIYTESSGEYGPFVTEKLTKVGNDYSCTDNYGATIKFVMENDKLKEIVVSGTGYDGTDYAGTYAPAKQLTIADILATNPNFPTSSTNDFADDSWINEKGTLMCLTTQTVPLFRYDNNIYDANTSNVTKVSDSEYTYQSRTYLHTFHLTNGILTSITVSGYSGKWDFCNGTYAPKTISHILPADFPTTKETGWVKENGSTDNKVYKDGQNIIIGTSPYPLNGIVVKDGKDYKYQSGLITITFVMESNTLSKVNFSTMSPTASGDYVQYKFLNSPISVEEGSTGDLEFITNAIYTNDSDVFVLIDNNIVPLVLNKDYTVSHGSTHVTLKSSYVSTLAAGTHTISIAVTGYKPISQTFTITSGKVPDTGAYDISSNNNLLLILSSISLLTIGTYLVIKKKKEN